MTIKHFGKLLAGNNGIRITEELIIYNDLELYNYKTEEAKCYTSLEELLVENPEVKAIIEEAEDFFFDWNGGRGASSSGGMGGGFSHAGGGSGGGRDEKLYNAELNLDNRGGSSVDHVIDKFKDKYGSADREYGAMVTEQGYVVQHMKGGAHSVGFYDTEKNGTFIHNHPSGSNFSDTDLHSFANSQLKSVVATSSNATTKGTYQITKNKNFKAKAFDKAVSKAQWPKDMDYNTGASWWLKKNQKTYGYTFKVSGVKKTSSSKKST